MKRSESYPTRGPNRLIGAIALAMTCTVSGALLDATLCHADYPERTRKGTFQASLGMGLNADFNDDESFLLGLEFGYHPHENIVIMPRIAFGIEGDYSLFFFMVDGRWVFDIPNVKLRHFKPFAGFGIGAALAKLDIPDAAAGFLEIDNTDAAFALEFPVGFDYNLPKNFSVGTEMQFVVPIDLFDDNFIYQWQIVTARYQF